MAAPTYLDSNVISYLTAWPSRDIVSLAHQQLTREWWDRQRHGFELHISELVAFEIGRGDPTAAKSRLEFVRDLPVLRITTEARRLADRIFRATTLPDKAASVPCMWRLPQSMEWIFYSPGTVLISRTESF